MSVSLPAVGAVLRATVVAAAGAGLVVAATQVPGAVAVGSSAPAHAVGGAQSGPVRGAQLLCAGPELMGVPGVHDLPVGVRVAAAAAPASALGATQPVSTPGTLTLTGMPGATLGQPGSARGLLVTAGRARSVMPGRPVRGVHPGMQPVAAADAQAGGKPGSPG